jgi:hypothetical protein
LTIKKCIRSRVFHAFGGKDKGKINGSQGEYHSSEAQDEGKIMKITAVAYGYFAMTPVFEWILRLRSV